MGIVGNAEFRVVVVGTWPGAAEGGNVPADAVKAATGAGAALTGVAAEAGDLCE